MQVHYKTIIQVVRKKIFFPKPKKRLAKTLKELICSNMILRVSFCVFINFATRLVDPEPSNRKSMLPLLKLFSLTFA